MEDLLYGLKVFVVELQPRNERYMIEGSLKNFYYFLLFFSYHFFYIFVRYCNYVQR